MGPLPSEGPSARPTWKAWVQPYPKPRSQYAGAGPFAGSAALSPNKIAMIEVNIITAKKALPDYSRTTEEILPFMHDWLKGAGPRVIRKAEKIFLGAGVDRRFGIMDVSEVFAPAGFESKNRLYMQAAKSLGRKGMERALVGRLSGMGGRHHGAAEGARSRF